MTRATAPDGRFYAPELDGLRFVAFLLVFLFHGGIPQVAPAIDAVAHAVGFTYPTPRGGVPWSLGRVVVGNGWVGVQLFFILSGYLIASLLLREQARFGRVDLRAFWMRRILRIWPLYYLVMAIAFIVLPGLDRRPWSGSIWPLWKLHFVPFALFAGNWSMGLIGPVPWDALSVLWSVCVEEQFYLFVPLLIARVRPRGRVPAIVALMLCGMIGRRLLAGLLERRSITPILFQYATITHLDTLLSGVLLAVLLRGGLPRMGRVATAVLSAFATIGVVAILCRDDLAHGGAIERTWSFAAIWSVGVAVVAISADGTGPWCALLRTAPHDRPGADQLRPLHVSRGRLLAPTSPVRPARLVPVPGCDRADPLVRVDRRPGFGILSMGRAAVPLAQGEMVASAIAPGVGSALADRSRGIGRSARADPTRVSHDSR